MNLYFRNIITCYLSRYPLAMWVFKISLYSLYLWNSTKYWTWPSFSFLAALKVITTWGQMLCVWIDTKIQRANKVVRVTYNYSKNEKIAIVFTKFSLQMKTIVHCRKLFGIWLSFSSSYTLEQNREYRIVM